MDTTFEQLNALFPVPASPAQLAVTPARVPRPLPRAGWTHDSTETVLKVLKDNHQRFHIFFNDKGFHNHASHHILAIYALGANSETIEAAYGTHTVYQKPAFPPPEEEKINKIITDSTWKNHFGDERYYQAYLAFFSAKLIEGPDAIRSVLEKYVFSKDANFVTGETGVAPMMLGRFLGGLLHPLIHAGYGVEFGLPGIVSEGVAQAAIHSPDAVRAFPENIFSDATFSDMKSKLESLLLSTRSSVPPNVHALTVLRRVAEDPAFAPKALGLPLDRTQNFMDVIMQAEDDKILKHVEDWAYALTTSPTPELLRAKFEEIVWMNTIAYGISGWAGRKQSEDESGKYNGDFVLMHLVTSALLLPPLLNVLSPTSAGVLLRTYFALSLIVYVGRGRAPLPVTEFYNATTEATTVPGSTVDAASDTLPPHSAPNPWLPIIQTTLVHPNEHLCKLQRALLHFAEVYGGTPKGAFAEIKGMEALDGSVFLRVAGLTADRLGWMREGEVQGKWDFTGFFKDELES